MTTKHKVNISNAEIDEHNAYQYRDCLLVLNSVTFLSYDDIKFGTMLELRLRPWIRNQATGVPHSSCHPSHRASGPVFVLGI
jgi:hypothetical protein